MHYAVIVTVTDECKHLNTVLLLHFYTYSLWFLWCGYAGSSLDVKIETDSNDAMEMMTGQVTVSLFNYLSHKLTHYYASQCESEALYF